MRLRFVAGTGLVSEAIIARSQICMPFTPSHVECVTPDGKYAGSHFGFVQDTAGFRARESNYDAGKFAHELFLDVAASPDQDKIFYDEVQKSIGEPYDWRAILDYMLPENFHTVNSVICSAKMTLLLRKALVLKWPIAVPAHLVSPRDLLLGLSFLMDVPH